jgi:hypothetical protein
MKHQICNDQSNPVDHLSTPACKVNEKRVLRSRRLADPKREVMTPQKGYVNTNIPSDSAQNYRNSNLNEVKNILSP